MDDPSRNAGTARRSALLPTPSGYRDYRALHRLPLAPWRRALDEIRRRHRLPAGAWRRATQGRNVVFHLEREAVVKLVPPMWRDQAEREATALALVAGRLGLRTPELLAESDLDGWRYLVLEHLPGRVLGWNWEALRPEERLAVAGQSGEIAARLHALTPSAEVAARLRFDWREMLDEQAAEAPANFVKGGLDPELIAAFPRFLADAGDLAAEPHVLLQGDLSAVNLIAEGEGTELRLTALLDFGDARMGPFEHEFISPAMHFYRGEDTVLDAFYLGYGLDGRERTPLLARRLMARSALYYSELLERYRARLPEPQNGSWPALTRAFWRLT